MKLAEFNATCPFEIGDKIKIRREIRGELAKRFHLIPATVVEEVHTITDIVCVHSVKNGTVTFMYELDNSGELVRVEMPPAPKAQEPRPAGRGETQNQTDTESGTLPPAVCGAHQTAVRITEGESRRQHDRNETSCPMPL